MRAKRSPSFTSNFQVQRHSQPGAAGLAGPAVSNHSSDRQHKTKHSSSLYLTTTRALISSGTDFTLKKKQKQKRTKKQNTISKYVNTEADTN